MNYKKLFLVIIPFLLVCIVSAADLSDYPGIFIENNRFNAIIVVGDKGTAEDVISASDIGMSIKLGSQLDVSTVKLVSEITDPNAQNLILIGLPIAISENGNSLIDNFYSGTPDKPLMKLVKNGDYHVLIVTSNTPQGIRDIGRILANYQDYFFQGKTFYLDDLEESKSCSDSDGGNKPNVKGTTIGKGDYSNNIERKDYCEDDNYLVEFYCEDDKLSELKQQCSRFYSCIDGACLKDGDANFLVVDSKGTSNDAIIITDVGLFLNSNDHEVSPSKLNSEVTKGMLDNRVTVFAYKGDVAIIVGSRSPSEHTALAEDISDFLDGNKGIDAMIIRSSQIKSDDLREIFEKQTAENDDKDLTEPDTESESVVPQEDECTSNNDCNDNNSCTNDLCSGTPKVCSSTETSIGCNHDGNCIPVGIRVENAYCDVDKGMKDQKSKGIVCNNNYECRSDVCLNNECVSLNLLQKVMNWFKRLFT